MKYINLLIIALIILTIGVSAKVYSSGYVWSSDVNLTNTGIININVQGDYGNYDVPMYKFHDVDANKTCYVLLGQSGIGGQSSVIQCS